MGNFVIRQIDINILFLGGFSFLIGVFSMEMMMKYLAFLIFGTLWLGLSNWLMAKRVKN